MNEVETLLFSEIVQLLVQKGNIKLIKKSFKKSNKSFNIPKHTLGYGN